MAVKPARAATIRAYRADDLDALAGVYAAAIRHLGPAHYSAAQVAAWSGFADDREVFADWIGHAATFVALDRPDRIVGFSGLAPAGHVASLFVAPGAQRRGIGSRLLERVLDEAGARGLSRLTTAASVFSRPLFEAYGFEVTEVEHTVVDGVPFTRFAMQRDR